MYLVRTFAAHERYVHYEHSNLIPHCYFSLRWVGCIQETTLPSVPNDDAFPNVRSHPIYKIWILSYNYANVQNRQSRGSVWRGPRVWWVAATVTASGECSNIQILQNSPSPQPPPDLFTTNTLVTPLPVPRPFFPRDLVFLPLFFFCAAWMTISWPLRYPQFHHHQQHYWHPPTDFVIFARKWGG